MNKYVYFIYLSHFSLFTIATNNARDELMKRIDGYVVDITDDFASKIANDFKIWSERVENDPEMPKAGHWGLQFLIADHQNLIKEKMKPIQNTIQELVRESFQNATADDKIIVAQDGNKNLVVYQK